MFSEELTKMIYLAALQPSDFDLFKYIACGAPTSKKEKYLCEIIEKLAVIDEDNIAHRRPPEGLEDEYDR